MKRILVIISIGLMFLTQGCYEDYITDFDYTTTYFTYQYPRRTLVVDPYEKMTFDFGVVLGGKYSNDKDERVEYEIDRSLLDDYPDLKLLPEDKYQLSNNSGVLTIPSGEFIGRVTVTLDKEWFLNQDDALQGAYALPVRIFNQTADSIPEGKDFSIIVLRYDNEYYGKYWLKGQDNTYDFFGQEIESEEVYTNKDLVSNRLVTLSSSAKDQVRASYIGMYAGGNYTMDLTVRSEDGLVAITPSPGSAVQEIKGHGYYTERDRQFVLDYTYYLDSYKHEVKDTLYYVGPGEVYVDTWQ